MPKNYVSFDSSKVIITLISRLGPHVVVGKPKGTFLKASLTADEAELNEGCDGEAQWNDIITKSVDFELTLQRYSESNTYLTALAEGKITFSLSGKDTSTQGSLAAGTNMRVKKRPDFEGADKNSTTVTWMLGAANGKVLHTGAKEEGLNVLGLTL